MTIVTLGIDLGKNLNSVVGLDAEGQVVLRRRVRRATLAELAGRLAPCTVAMEACCGAHHVGRLFAAKGHEVRLMSPEYVRPYVRAQKNDDNDAAGIAALGLRFEVADIALPRMPTDGRRRRNAKLGRSRPATHPVINRGDQTRTQVHRKMAVPSMPTSCTRQEA